MPRRRCARCKGYFEEMWYVSAVEAFCTEDCALAKSYQRSKVARKPSKDDIPADVRQAVLKRDSICQMCEATAGLHVHHIYYRSEAPIEWRHDPSNLITLCAIDHDLVHSDKKKYQKVLLDKMVQRGYADPHV